MNSLMKDLSNPRLIYGKAILFLLGGIISVVLILLEHPGVKVAVLLAQSSRHSPSAVREVIVNRIVWFRHVSSYSADQGGRHSESACYFPGRERS
jgi:hypothetical protein